MDHLSWDDLRFVQAVGKAGSVRGGAALLKVSHQTVARHIAALEAALGTKLFLRSPAGYLLTPASEALLETAESVDELVNDTARRIVEADMRPAGTVRLTLVHWMIPGLCWELADFSRKYPDITLEIVGDLREASFTKREADVAVRLARAPMGDLVGRRVARSHAAIFASERYLRRVPKRRRLEQHLWIGFDEPWRSMRPGQWMQKNLPDAKVVARTGTTQVMVELIRAGVGIGLLPCFVGDRDPELQRVRAAPIDALGLPIWVLTHPDLKRLARVRVLMDFLCERIVAMRAFYEGRAK